jgi:hypothetical protein
MFGRRFPRIGRGGALAASVALFSSAAAVAAPEAELRFPSSAPRASVTQWIGLTKVTVDYQSPAVAGRKIWGSVVPTGSVWLVGDGEAPTISFSREVSVAGSRVPAGAYALLAIPSAGSWTVVLNRRRSIRRAADRDPALDVARATVHPDQVPPRERLTFLFSDFAEQHAALDLEWEAVRIRVPIELETDAQVTRQLQSLEGAWRRFADAAWYALEKRNDVTTGLRQINQSIALRETWYNTWIKARILAASRDYGQARELADRALRLGRAAGDDFTAERQIEEDLASWRPRTTASEPREATRGRAQPVPPQNEVSPAAPSTLTVEADNLSDPPVSLAERMVSLPAASAAKPPSAKSFGPLIARGLPDLRRCYQRALRQDPSLAAARLTLSIAVGSSGRVTAVTVDPPTATEALGSCLKAAVVRWAFPASSTAYETQVPLVLSGRT